MKMKDLLMLYRNNRQMRVYGLYYPLFLIAMCMLAEWLERQY